MTDTWLASPPADYCGPRIVLVHGLAAGRHMERHLLSFLREAGFADTSLFSHYARPAALADHLAEAAHAGRQRVLIGYSQGGFQCVKAAQELDRRNEPVDLLVTVAAGGAGRLYFPQIGFNPRRIPANVKRCLNYFALGDHLGSDPVERLNHAQAASDATHLENFAYPRDAGVDHLAVVRCYPPAKVAPMVRERFLDRLLAELHGEATAPTGAHALRMRPQAHFHP
jgi:pimeloyl-ACP methyl ester carboxylesterase